MSVARWFLPLFITSTLILGLLAVGVSGSRTNIRLVDAGVRVEQLGTRFVTGTLKNFTGRAYADLSLEVHVLDRSGEILHSFAEHTGKLPAGATWDFDVPVMAENAVRYRVDLLRCRPDSGGLALVSRPCALLHEGAID
ncbi:MAG: FxLYD domain-containing protein [Gammaproteobacteria bacterium]|nr:FxLYD domain-containing protein [Gammaproteobacteria bacterium]NNF62016.1 hypothetical protein [Gammaproteobacteria bacterium]